MFSGLMLNTWIAATVVAVIAGVTGFFAVLRGSTFAAHAIPDGALPARPGPACSGSTRRGPGRVLGGGALGIAGLGRRARHDVATALTFVMMLGSARCSSAGAPNTRGGVLPLFGELFGVSQAEVLPIVVLGACHRRDHRMFRPLMLPRRCRR